VAELLQGLDAGVNEIILLAVAMLFLGSLESRIKRNWALRALHELRSIAHVIDMHQTLADGLSRKIWQKILILDAAVTARPENRTPEPSQKP